MHRKYNKNEYLLLVYLTTKHKNKTKIIRNLVKNNVKQTHKNPLTSKNIQTIEQYRFLNKLSI